MTYDKKNYGDFAELADFSYWCSCIGKALLCGLRSRLVYTQVNLEMCWLVLELCHLYHNFMAPAVKHHNQRGGVGGARDEQMSQQYWMDLVQKKIINVVPLKTVNV